MKTSVEAAGPCRKTLRIEIPAEKITSAYNELLALYKKDAVVPGFRKGKAPVAMVATRFSKALLEEVKKQVVPEAYHEAVAQEKLNVITVVDVEEKELALNQPFSFTVSVDVPPDFDLPKYQDIPVPDKAIEITEAQVDEQVQELRMRTAKYAEISDRAVKSGDIVQIDFTGTLDGQPVEAAIPKAAGLGQGKEFWIRADDDSFLPGLGPALVGSSVGDQKTVPVNFDDKFTLTELRGVQVTYAVTVKGIRERQPAEMNAEFFKKLDVADEAALRAKIRQDLTDMKSNQLKQEQRDAVVAHLLKETTVEVPETQVAQRTRSVLSNLANHPAIRNMTKEQFEAQKEQLFQDASRTARDNVKLGYILHRIAAENNITVTAEEVEQRIAALAQYQGVAPAQMHKHLEEQGSLQDLQSEVLDRKTVDFVLSKAKPVAA